MQSKSKLVTLVISLVAAISLWLYVVTVENPEHTATISNIPVTFEGVEELREDQGLIITSGLDATVTLRVTGKRSEVTKLSEDNITLTVDVGRISRAQTYTMNYSIEYPSDVKASSITVDSKLPSSVVLTVESAASKTIDVRGELIGNTAEGYTTEEMSFDYEQIVIQGPAEIVGQVEYALVTLVRENLDKSVTSSLSYTLMNADGEAIESSEITCDVEEIEVTLPVVKFKHVPLNVEFIDGGGATSDNVVINKIEPSTVTISGDASVVDLVNQINLGNIDLSNLVGSGTYEFNILLPNNVKNVSGEETATVSVEIRGLQTRQLRISTIEFAQVPEGLTASAITQTITVTIRAALEDIDNISSTNVHVIADLSGIGSTIGSYTVPLTVEIYGYPNAGVIGTYNAVITLAEEVDEPVEPIENPEESGDNG